ncbi:uncharacterized protein LOC133906078, partial [Phragmites australis]|uniref:uncharacterized protein LOC133906078 n=1 Tax=Phragmites australis TaxID=29695 RepID=UPI002D79F81A
ASPHAGLAESATSAFLQKLDRLAEAAGADLQRLESMAFGAVSLEELLGHFGEALSVYVRQASAIEARLASFGYEPPEVEPDVDAEVEDGAVGEPGNSCFGESSSVLRAARRRRRTFSDACLATLSYEATDFAGSPKKLYKKPESADEGQKIVKDAEFIPPRKETNGQVNAFQGMIRASKEYEQLPPYMKTLASWEELQEAVSKLNSYFGADKTQGSAALNQDDVGAIGLGRKGRSCLLILLRLNQLTMETVDGSIFYILRKIDS